MVWRIFLIVVVLVGSVSFAEEITVFDMRKTLPLSDSEKIYRDFYLSKGFNSGLKPGMILTVKRKQPLYDTIHNRSAGDLNVAVGRIKVIHCDKDVAVAREYQDFSRDDMPLLEDNFIMVGDEADLSSATTESKMKGSKAAEGGDLPEKPIESAQLQTFSVDFASQSPDNSATAPSVDGPVVQ